MLHKKHLFLFFSLVLFLTSCVSIEKRVYRNGYYVNFISTKGDEHVNKLAKRDSSSFAPYTLAQVTNNIQVPDIIPSLKAPLLLNSVHSSQDTTPPKKRPKKDIGPKKFDEGKDVTKDHRKTHPLSVVSLILGVYCFASVVWILQGLTASVFAVLFALGVVFSIIGIGFCLFALSEIRKNPDKYEGRGLVFSALILLLISPLILLLVALL